MLRSLFGILVMLHGLIHLWFVTLSQRWVPFEPEMGWTGDSWLFTRLLGGPATRWVATILYALVTLTFFVSGIGVFTRGDWWQPLMAGSAVASALIALMFWDGGTQYIVQKGLVGFLLNAAILTLLLGAKWPASRM